MNKLKGDAYELQIKNYIINELNNKAYLWTETPENILIDFGIIGSHNQQRLNRINNNLLIDTGIDIIQIDDQNKCILVQCKNGYTNGITINNLAGFFGWMCSLPELVGYVYYTNKLSKNIRELPYNNRIKYIKQPYIETIQNDITEFKPYDYQLEAFKQFKSNFNNRGILSLPCGTGKTYITYLCSTLYKKIIILSPLKEFAKQNLNKFIEYGYNNNTLLVDSDGERDIDNINKFINNDSFLISSTFCSIDVISKLKLDNVLIIIDEFHNLSKNNVTNENNDFYKLLNSDYNILFVSATPRVYELEDEDYNDSIFGNTIYNMTFTDAIKNKYITDYRIWLPSIHEDNEQLEEELSIYDINSVIKAKCNYLFSCLLNNGSRKCIIYCIDTTEIIDMINGMNELNKFYYINYNINQITSKNNDKQRNKILNNFSNGTNIQLLFSVRILDECIDIPSCDSIYITYPSQSKIRTIQRLCRCIRLDKNNKFKIGNIFIWCNEYDLILETLSGIKEYDIFFKDKIQLNNTNYFGKSNNKFYINDKQLISNYLVGIKEFKQLTWIDKLKLVSEYIDNNSKRPSMNDKNKDIKQLGQFLSDQQKNYKNNKYIMKDTNIKKLYEEFIEKYKEYFLDNNEIWLNNLKLCEKYIIDNKKKPSKNDKNKDIKYLGSFLSHQQQNYKNNEHIMKDSNIRKLYEEFIEKYKEYFLDNNEIWLNNLKLVSDYIDNNSKRPSMNDKNKDIKQLGQFLQNQQTNYKNNKDIMKDTNIKKLYEEFIEKYKEYFLDNNEIWLKNLNLVSDYIDKNKKRPSQTDKNKDIKQLGKWISTQQRNYKSNKQIMKDSNIRKLYEEFIEKYKKYL
uniref:Helicase ATP-binding domain-containing protein n=1 Tax=viral metagenome TaxID=1070528 RepID=A0A6C0EFK8_9ZZZZ